MIRLWVPQDLDPGCPDISLNKAQSHYLSNVMRLRDGDELLVFNGRDGEALVSYLKNPGGRGLGVLAITKVDFRPFEASPDLDLVIALVKRARLETIVEKAAELGARRVRLTITERTNADHARVDRLRAIATEAAEQTGRLDVPEVLEPVKLDRLLADLEGEGRRLMFCDEAGDAGPAASVLGGQAAGSWAILIGPEGGFSPAERARVRALAAATPVSLGPRILRADTAAIAAMTLWQSALGDWAG